MLAYLQIHQIQNRSIDIFFIKIQFQLITLVISHNRTLRECAAAFAAECDQVLSVTGVTSRSQESMFQPPALTLF
jgi:hypothetical protein